MIYASNSTLKAVQGSAIKDLTDGRCGANAFGQAQSPCRRPTNLSYSSLTTSLEPRGLRLTNVSVPTKPRYIPNQRPPPQVCSTLPNGAAVQTATSRNVVVSRFLLVDGNISFVVGSQIDGLITTDTQEVPIANILDHVSPAELERFENQDFFNEDERERLLPPKKTRKKPEGLIIVKKKPGRPKGSLNKITKTLTLAESSHPFKRRPGRPRGSQNKAKAFASTKLSALTDPSTPIKGKQFSVVIPSFNGPQPRELERIHRTETESVETLNDRKPQYSMIVASGLGQSDTDEATSRDQSVGLTSSPQKRRFVTSNGPIDLDSDTDGDESSSRPTKRPKTLPETSPDPIADDSAALVRQLHARDYGPHRPAKLSTFPHRQSKPSSTLNSSTGVPIQSQTNERSSSLGSVSSDSLVESTQRPLKILPTQQSPSIERSPPAEAIRPQGLPSGGKADKQPIMTSFFPYSEPVKATPARSMAPPQSIRRKVSLTPHTPPGMRLNHSSSLYGSSERRPQPTISLASTQVPLQQAKTRSLQSSRILPPPPQKKRPFPPDTQKLSQSSRKVPPPLSSQPSSSASKSGVVALPPAPSVKKRPSHSPLTAPPPSKLSQSSASTSTSTIGFAGLPPVKTITDYFAPKAPAPKAPAPTKKTAVVHTPSSQLLGAVEAEDSEASEDQLARRSPSSSDSDSIGSEEVIVVRPQKRVTSTSQAATPPEPSSDHDPMDYESSTTSESEDEDRGTTRASHTAADSSFTTTFPAKTQTYPEILNGPLDFEDGEEEEEEEDSDSDSGSDSDSVSSEVMVVRSAEG